MGAGLTANGSIRNDKNFDLTIIVDGGTATAPALPAYPPSLGGNTNLGGNQLASGNINVTADNIDLGDANQQAETIDLNASQDITGTTLQQTANEIQLNANTINVSEADSLANTIALNATNGNLRLS